MDTDYYLNKFQQAALALNQPLFSQNGLDFKVGIWHNSVVLKLQKKSWLNQNATARPFQESFFCCVWLSEETLATGKLYYNIHALKLRQLNNYTIKSRDFAEAFRVKFKPFEKDWPNVSVKFGPLTLMQGWVNMDEQNFEPLIAKLAEGFLPLALIIDDLLLERRKISSVTRTI